MDCKKCGALVPDGGTFCPNCGARADGKKNCNFCGNLIDESAVYCTYCGARVDGKKICKNCGEEILGNFCTKCGYGVKEKTIAVTPNKPKKEKPINDGTHISAFAKVEKVLTPSLSLLIMAVLFICSFFIGITMQANSVVTGENSTVTESVDVFYYFSSAFKDVDSIISPYYNNANYNMAKTNLTLVNVICLITICINFIVQLTLAIIGGIKGGKDIYFKRESSIAKYAAGMFVSFVTTVVIIISSNYFSVDGVSSGVVAKATTDMSFGAAFGIIFSAVLLATVFILMQVIKGRSALKPNNLKFIISVIVSIVLVGLTLAFFEKIGVGVSENKESINVEMVIGSSNFMQIILMEILMSGEPTLFETANNLNIVAYYLSVIGIYIVAAAFASLMFAIFSEKNKKVSTIIFTSIALILSITCTILLNLSTKEYNLVGSIEPDLIAYNVIPCIIFAALSLASVIVYSALNKKKQVEKENLDIELE